MLATVRATDPTRAEDIAVLVKALVQADGAVARVGDLRRARGWVSAEGGRGRQSTHVKVGELDSEGGVGGEVLREHRSVEWARGRAKLSTHESRVEATAAQEKAIKVVDLLGGEGQHRLREP